MDLTQTAFETRSFGIDSSYGAGLSAVSPAALMARVAGTFTAGLAMTALFAGIFHTFAP